MSRALILAALLTGCGTEIAALGSVDKDAGRDPWPPPGLERCEKFIAKAQELRAQIDDAGVPPSCRLNPLQDGCPGYEWTMAFQACLSDIVGIPGDLLAPDARDR